MRRMSPVVGVVLMVSVLFMAATAIVLWVNGRPTEANEVVAADGVPAEEVPQDEPVLSEPAADTGGRVEYDVTVEGENVHLLTVPGHEKLTIYIPPSEPVVVEEPIILEEPVVIEEPVVVVEDGAAEPVVVVEEPVVVDPVPTATPIVAVVEPVVVEEIVPTPVPVVVSVNGQPVVFVPHTVQAGDTLYNVARRLGSSVELMAENGLSSEDMIVGAVISVPVANSNYCPGMTSYVVRDADTVYSISTRFNVNKDLIRDQNNLGPAYSIRAGQVICIPNG